MTTPERPDRPRDAQGRPQSDRPRDALGRPLAWDAPPDLIAEREPEDVVRTPAETLARAAELLRVGRPFNAHDVFEAAWKNGPPAERDLWQGLAQLCVAVTHRARGNEQGARTVAERGAERLTRYVTAPATPVSAGPTDPSDPARPTHGVDLPALIAWAAAFPTSPAPFPVPALSPQ